MYTSLRHIDTEVDHFNDVVQVETIDGTEDSSGHILMTDFFSGLTVAATPPNMDPYMVIDTFFSHWVVELNGDGFGIPNKYMYTSSGRKLDTKEGKKLCEELELTWKYSKMGKVITLSPDCKGIFFQSLQALKEDILLAEAVFAHNCKLRKGTKLSPFQLVKGKQSEPPPVDDTAKLTHSSTNMLKQLGVQAQEKKSGDPQEVTNQHTSLVGYSAELAVTGNSQQVYQCGRQQPQKGVR